MILFLQIAFRYALVVDNGHSVINGGGRTKPGYDSHGYQKTLANFVRYDMGPEMSKYGTSYDELFTSWNYSFRIQDERRSSILLWRV